MPSRMVRAAVVVLVAAACSAPVPTADPDATACGVWRVERTPNRGSDDNFLTAVAASSRSDVWAVGVYKDAAGRGRTLTLHFDGRAWRVVPSPNPEPQAFLNGVAARSSSDVWAVGVTKGEDDVARSLVLHWDGRRWSISPSPNASRGDNYLTSVAIGGRGTVWAAGYYEHRGRFSALILRRSRAGWTIEPTPDPPGLGAGLNAVAAPGGEAPWAVGGYTPNDQPTQPLILHRDAGAWRLAPGIGEPEAPSSLSGLAATEDGMVAVGGYRALRGDGAFALAERNGRWSVEPRSTVGLVSESFSAVAAAGEGLVYAVGTYSDGRGERTLVERRIGRTWTQVPTPSIPRSDSKLFGLATLPTGEAWAVGNSSGQEAIERTLIVHFCPA